MRRFPPKTFLIFSSETGTPGTWEQTAPMHAGVPAFYLRANIFRKLTSSSPAFSRIIKAVKKISIAIQ